MVIDGVEWLPVSFVPKLVKSILADEKTETRRIISGAPHSAISANVSCLDGLAVIETENGVEKFKSRYGRPAVMGVGKIIRPATRLWVREAFVAVKRTGERCKIDEADLVIFRDGAKKFRTGTLHKPDIGEAPLSGYRPPMHLPHWASRINLEVKSLGAERVQDITEEAAIAEGFKMIGDECDHPIQPRYQFRIAWDEINGSRKDQRSEKLLTWGLNPFVWVVSFKRIDECS